MYTKVNTPEYTIEATCPICKKNVEAIKIDKKNMPLPNYFGYYTLHILGCPECNIMFFKKEIDDPILEADLKRENINF